MTPSDQAREYAYQQYIVPARLVGNRTVTFTSGAIHDALGFLDRNRINCVCGALEAQKFETQRGVKLVARNGPRFAASTTFTFAI
jgi:hypothetical protein